jgi:hypothetical protein
MDYRREREREEREKREREKRVHERKFKPSSRELKGEELAQDITTPTFQHLPAVPTHTYVSTLVENHILKWFIAHDALDFLLLVDLAGSFRLLSSGLQLYLCSPTREGVEEFGRKKVPMRERVCVSGCDKYICVNM